MKKIVLFSVFCLFILRGVTAQNIYESISKKAEILTLSEGKYQEVFSNDTVVRIGSVLFNRVTNEVVDFVTNDTILTYSEMDLSTRFLSVDPIGRKYPELTPYQFASNRPIDGIDLDGLEYLSFEKCMFEMKYGGVSIKTGYIKEEVVTGKDEQGRDYIGTNRRIFDLKVTFVNMQQTAKPTDDTHMDPQRSFAVSTDPLGEMAKESQPGRRNIGSETPLNPAGNIDKRQTKRIREWEQTARESPNGVPALSKGSAAMSGVIELYKLGQVAYYSYTTMAKFNEANEQLKKVTLVIGDLAEANKQGLIPKEYQNASSLSLIGNFLLQGDKSDMTADLLKIAVKVFNTITSKKLPINVIETRGDIKINTVQYKQFNDDGTEKH